MKLIRLLPLLAMSAAALSSAAPCNQPPLPAATAEAPRRFLFVGNSFLHGNEPPVLHYNASRVTDLNGSGYGGVPGIFKQLADDVGLHVEVAVEMVSGQTLQFHLQQKRALIAAPRWDVVVLQEVSTLHQQRPGDSKLFVKTAGALQAAVHEVNPAARVYLMETWARADQVYRAGGRWGGLSLEEMQDDLHAAYARAQARASCIAGVLPVGDAAVRAVQDGVADRNPYDGIDPGKFNLWGADGFHFSAWGSYMQALVMFGKLTGHDPAGLGVDNRAGRELGLSAAQIQAAQAVASRQWHARHVVEFDLASP